LLREQTLTEIAPGANNDAAEVMVFKSNISDAVMVLPNDWPQRNPSQKLVDFVINDSSPIFDDLTPGNQGFFELVRGVGKVIGLEDDPEQSRTESVLGSRFGSDVDALPFPSTPLPRDLIGRRVFDDNINSGGFGDRYEIEMDLTGSAPVARGWRPQSIWNRWRQTSSGGEATSGKPI